MAFQNLSLKKNHKNTGKNVVQAVNLTTWVQQPCMTILLPYAIAVFCGSFPFHPECHHCSVGSVSIHIVLLSLNINVLSFQLVILWKLFLIWIMGCLESNWEIFSFYCTFIEVNVPLQKIIVLYQLFKFRAIQIPN